MSHWPVRPDAWDAWLREQGSDAGFLQTSSWAAISGTVNGTVSHLVALTSGVDAQPVAGALFTAAAGADGIELTCHEGPVLPGEAPERSLAPLLEETEELASRLKAAIVRFHGGPPAAAWVRSARVEATFERHGYSHRPWQTALVNLRRPDEELMRSFRQAARKAVRRCQELGLKVIECHTFSEYSRLCLDPYGLPHDGSRALWETDEGKNYRFFAVLDPDDSVLATIGSYSFNRVATEIESRRTSAGISNGAPAQDLLHWELFRAHRDAEDVLFNLAGFAPQPADQKEAGIRRFKEKWGGEVIPVSSHELDRRSAIGRRAGRARRRAGRVVRSLIAPP